VVFSSALVECDMFVLIILVSEGDDILERAVRYGLIILVRIARI